MEEVAYQYEPSLPHSRTQSAGYASPPQDYTSTFQIDEDLLSRIRALLASRHELHPARPPKPSPDLSSWLHSPTERDSHLLVQSPISTPGSVTSGRLPGQDPDHLGSRYDAVAQTTQSISTASKSPVDASARKDDAPLPSEVKQFDGSAGHTSIPGKDRNGEPWSMQRDVVPELAPLPGPVIESSKLGRHDDIGNTPVEDVTEDSSEPAAIESNKHERVGRPPIPGSYRSEYDVEHAGNAASVDSKAPLGRSASPLAKDAFISPNDGTPAATNNPHSADEHSTSPLKIAPYIRNDGSVRAIRSTSPMASTRSVTSAKSAHHHLLRPSASPADFSLPAPPVLSVNGNPLDFAESGISSKLRVQQVRGAPEVPKSQSPDGLGLTGIGKPLSELLEDLPPPKEGNLVKDDNVHLTVELAVEGDASTAEKAVADRKGKHLHGKGRMSDTQISSASAQETSQDISPATIVRKSSSATHATRATQTSPTLPRKPSAAGNDSVSPEDRRMSRARSSRRSSDMGQTRSWLQQMLGREPGKVIPRESKDMFTVRPKRSNLKQAQQLDPPEPEMELGQTRNENGKTLESFNKVITDLEGLLHEAMSIARRATEKQDTKDISTAIEEATITLRNNDVSKREPEMTVSDPDLRRLAVTPAKSLDDLVVYHEPLLARRGIDYSSSSYDSDYESSSESQSTHSSNLRRSISLSQLPTRRVKIDEGAARARPMDNSRRQFVKTPYPPTTRHPSIVSSAENHELEILPKSSKIDIDNREATRSSGFRQEGALQPERLPPSILQGTSRRVLIAPHVSSQGSFHVTRDWAYPIDMPVASVTSSSTDLSVSTMESAGLRMRRPSTLSKPAPAKAAAKEQVAFVSREKRDAPILPSKKDVRKHIKRYKEPPIQPRSSSSHLLTASMAGSPSEIFQPTDSGPTIISREPTMTGMTSFSDPEFTSYGTNRKSKPKSGLDANYVTSGYGDDDKTLEHLGYSNTGSTSRSRQDFQIQEPSQSISSHLHRRRRIARDWPVSKKRYVATVTCITTSLIGCIIGIYAGEVPKIQYRIADQHHYAILGNVVLYFGMAIPTLLFWPLPMLHGRKPYTLVALALVLPLQFPQGLAVDSTRSPNTPTYRVGILLPRAFTGIALGFLNINLKATLLDLFGASLQSTNPHQELFDENDVRRHGGGMGVWLGICSWCYSCSIGVGFLIGALIIDKLEPTWGFWIVVIMTATVLLLNVLVPEVRRKAYRRSTLGERSASDIARRNAKGEVTLHVKYTAPLWWGEEVVSGLVLCKRMIQQPGFMVLSLYLGWIYGQIVMVVVLLGALTSRYYRFRPPYVGLCVAAIPIGGLIAVPFQKASLFSRSRSHPPRTDSMTFQKRITWTSHLVRRAIFMIVLPFAGLAYTLTSTGPPMHYMAPTFFAALIGFLSNLAIAECHGLIMETYDTSDLQPGMTGRPRGNSVPESVRKKRTNYSCFPRVSAAIAISQTWGFLIAAATTVIGGRIERKIGAQAATGCVAGVLLGLTLLLISVLWRFRQVQVIPDAVFGGRSPSVVSEGWRPVVIGNPSGKMRRMSVLELGRQSRWTEIRRKNKLFSF